MIARRTSFLLLLLLMLPLALLACDGDGYEEENAEEPTEGAEAALTFESGSGLTVVYQDGWLVQEGERGVYLANNDLVMNTVLDADGTEMPADGVAVTILPPLTTEGYPGLVDLDPPALVEKVAATLPDVLGGVEIGETEEATIGDYPAARVSVTRPSQLAEGYLIGFKPEDDLAILALVQAREGAMDGNEETVARMLQSISYQSPDASPEPTETQPSVVGPPTTTPEGAGPGTDATPTAEAGA